MDNMAESINHRYGVQDLFMCLYIWWYGYLSPWMKCFPSLDWWSMLFFMLYDLLFPQFYYDLWSKDLSSLSICFISPQNAEIFDFIITSLSAIDGQYFLFIMMRKINICDVNQIGNTTSPFLQPSRIISIGVPSGYYS